MAFEVARRRFTAAEYARMGEAGVLDEDDRLELIDGEILELAPIGYGHAACVRRLTGLFSRLFGDSVQVSVQNPIDLDEHNQPQPDLVLLRPRDDFYSSAHPTAADILLLVEVARPLGSTIDRSRCHSTRCMASMRSGSWTCGSVGCLCIAMPRPTATGQRGFSGVLTR